MSPDTIAALVLGPGLTLAGAVMLAAHLLRGRR